jgi:hypothetical protein
MFSPGTCSKNPEASKMLKPYGIRLTHEAESWRGNWQLTILFSSLGKVRETARCWMQKYNDERGQDSLGKMNPAEFYKNTRKSTFELST